LCSFLIGKSNRTTTDYGNENEKGKGKYKAGEGKKRRRKSKHLAAKSTTPQSRAQYN
jgi:hypothetical protein